MKKKVFIDGKAGTTGLRIYERLSGRDDIEIITLCEEERKNIDSRKMALNSADIAFLCLPDAAAIEAVSLIENDNTVVIDTSTAHRTDADWTYGFPEISKELDNAISESKRIAVPGCHAGGFIALVKPLIDANIIDKSTLLTCHSVTGYSGGGKNMIAEYESEGKSELLSAPRQYGIKQMHKHLKEMKAITGLENEPIFCPIVSDFYSGMLVTVPLFSSQLNEGKSVSDIKKVYSEMYNSSIVNYSDEIDEEGFISAAGMSFKDSMQITVSGNDDRILLIARYDNLGKGASGAAIECLNMVLGSDKTAGLDL
ncbi:MAG: N-acetyl-gamma-glutamyl-phosphate reductase [Clostridia bacterium]|nr:N-acetyl-gamma-glutamyl-phosphate reductase [Clostridia bacterium]